MLVGNSFGGAVALRTALAHPDRVERLALVGPGFPGWSFGEEMHANWEQVQAAFDAGDLEAAAELSVDFWVGAAASRLRAPAAAARARARRGAEPDAGGRLAGRAAALVASACRRSS